MVELEIFLLSSKILQLRSVQNPGLLFDIGELLYYPVIWAMECNVRVLNAAQLYLLDFTKKSTFWTAWWFCWRCFLPLRCLTQKWKAKLNSAYSKTNVIFLKIESTKTLKTMFQIHIIIMAIVRTSSFSGLFFCLPPMFINVRIFLKGGSCMCLLSCWWAFIATQLFYS